jgi:hypothetical protein
MIRSGQLKYKAPVTVTSNYTILAADDYIVCNGAGAISLTLPIASENTGRRMIIKTIADQVVNSASSNVVPIDSATAGTSILPAFKGSFVEMISDGANWIVMTYFPANLLSYS